METNFDNDFLMISSLISNCSWEKYKKSFFQTHLLYKTHLCIKIFLMNYIHAKVKIKYPIHRCYVPLQFSPHALNDVTLTLCSRHVFFMRLVACKEFKACFQSRIPLSSFLTFLVNLYSVIWILYILIYQSSGKKIYIFFFASFDEQ